MQILIAGGTGFVGTRLCKDLLSAGHSVTCLTRQKNFQTKSDVVYKPWDGKKLDCSDIFDVIINLCGRNISDGRWSKSIKKDLYASRINPTNAICNYIKSLPDPSHPLLLNASAIGFYPSSVDRQTEINCSPCTSKLFSRQLVESWEEAACSARQYGAKVVCMRFGVVLGVGGGMLQKLAYTFKLGLGAVLGDRSYKMSWISIGDLSRAILHLLAQPSLHDIYNFTSPDCCSKQEFANSYAKFFHKKCYLRMPSPLVKFLFGQMGQELLLSNQNIYPENLLDSGFVFYDSTIASFFKNIYKG